MQRLKPVAPTHNLREITIVQAVDRTREERTRCQPLFRSIRTRLAPIEGGGRGRGKVRSQKGNWLEFRASRKLDNRPIALISRINRWRLIERTFLDRPTTRVPPRAREACARRFPFHTARQRRRANFLTVLNTFALECHHSVRYDNSKADSPPPLGSIWPGFRQYLYLYLIFFENEWIPKLFNLTKRGIIYC